MIAKHSFQLIEMLLLQIAGQTIIHGMVQNEQEIWILNRRRRPYCTAATLVLTLLAMDFYKTVSYRCVWGGVLGKTILFFENYAIYLLFITQRGVKA